MINFCFSLGATQYSAEVSVLPHRSVQAEIPTKVPHFLSFQSSLCPPHITEKNSCVLWMGVKTLPCWFCVSRFCLRSTSSSVLSRRNPANGCVYGFRPLALQSNPTVSVCSWVVVLSTLVGISVNRNYLEACDMQFGVG